MEIKHMYIGKEPKKGGVGGFFKTPKENKNLIFTLAFISKSDAEAFYGKGNYQKVLISKA